MRVCVVSLSRIADDPRVRKQGDTLHAAGHRVAGVGITGGRAVAPDWPIIGVAAPLTSPAKKAAAAPRMLIAGRVPRVVEPVVLSSQQERALIDALLPLAADVYHAHDWWVLPAAAIAARRTGAALVYDSHEYAVELNVQDPRWRLFFPRYIRAIEARYVPTADAVITVSQGIARLLQRDYKLRRLPSVIRNVPHYQSTTFRPTGTPITVLYQGAYQQGRGLEALIDSVPAWRDTFLLELRGIGSPAYEESLRGQASRSSASSRIHFRPPVAPGDMVRTASAADVGVHPVPGMSSQARFSLPNKFFEYTGAGLALCVSDLPEMRRLIERYGHGVLIEAPHPTSIATAINALTQESVDEHRRNALVAARDLCWEREQQRLLEIYDALNEGLR